MGKILVSYCTINSPKSMVFWVFWDDFSLILWFWLTVNNLLMGYYVPWPLLQLSQILSEVCQFHSGGLSQEINHKSENRKIIECDCFHWNGNKFCRLNISKTLTQIVSVKIFCLLFLWYKLDITFKLESYFVFFVLFVDNLVSFLIFCLLNFIND